MHYVFLFARIYPYWALAVSVVLLQIAIFFRRRESSLQYSVLGTVAFLGIGLICWFVFRGDLHSDDWVRAVFGMNG